MIEEITQLFARQIDNDMYDFLEENGYCLERGNTKQIVKLKDELARQDKQLRIEYLDTKIKKDNKNYIRTDYVIFFDSLSNPLSKDEVDELIRKEHDLKKEELI